MVSERKKKFGLSVNYFTSRRHELKVEASSAQKIYLEDLLVAWVEEHL